MRAILVLLGVIVAAPSVRAETVLVMSEPGAELDTALRVVMAGRGVAVADAPHPLAALRLERAAIAQRTAMQVGAAAAVWIDDADVCAVTADGHQFRHAPLPPEAASPRVFAAIATSLLDEMIRPETWAVDVNVNVNIGPGGPRVALVDAPVVAAPGLAVVAPAPLERAHEGTTLLEIGPILSPLTYGAQAAVMFPFKPGWRLGGSAAMNITWDGVYKVGAGAIELRHVGKGRKHWDLGPELGFATDSNDPVMFTGFRFARTWELTSSALSLSIAPLVIVPLGGDTSPPLFPGVYSSLRWQVPL